MAGTKGKTRPKSKTSARPSSGAPDHGGTTQATIRRLIQFVQERERRDTDARLTRYELRWTGLRAQAKRQLATFTTPPRLVPVPGGRTRIESTELPAALKTADYVWRLATAILGHIAEARWQLAHGEAADPALLKIERLHARGETYLHPERQQLAHAALFRQGRPRVPTVPTARCWQLTRRRIPVRRSRRSWTTYWRWPTAPTTARSRKCSTAARNAIRELTCTGSMTGPKSTVAARKP